MLSQDSIVLGAFGAGCVDALLTSISGIQNRPSNLKAAVGSAPYLRPRSSSIRERNVTSPITKTIYALSKCHASGAKEKACAVFGVLWRIKVTNAESDYICSRGSIHCPPYCSLLNKDPAFIKLLLDPGLGQLEGSHWGS